MTSCNNKEEFESMQQEAIRRVREMQKRADSYIKSPEKPPEKKIEANPNKEQPHNHSGNDFFMKNNRPDFQQQPHNNQNIKNQQEGSKNAAEKNEKPKEEKKPEQTAQNRQNASNPFAQLFGSNLGGFNRFKNFSNDNKKSEHAFTDVSGSVGKLLKNFQIDEEKLLILILIYVLYKNGADIKLLLALGYLII